MSDLDELRDLLVECVYWDYTGHWTPDEWHDRALAILKRIGWEMTFLKELGTTAFDLDVMTATISFEGGIINCVVWMRFVPERFRAIAERQIKAVFEERRGAWLTEREQLNVILILQQLCYMRVRDLLIEERS